MSRIIEECATVWRAPFKGARRRFSRRTAYREWASHLVNEKYRECGCEHDVGYVCGLHVSGGRFDGGGWQRLRDRLSRWLEWCDSRGER